MVSHRKLIMLVILSLLMKVALSQNGVFRIKNTNIFGWEIWPTIHVYLRNDIGRGLVLTASCYNNIKGQARDREFLPGRMTKFTQFTKSFWGGDLYSCMFHFGNKRRSFTIYKGSRDNSDKGQCRHCFWSIRPYGACALNGLTKKYDICYNWD
ncbi:Plant self-incompatibility S1 [Arabidopsis suecica]|uniref:Plant self-incompatibility S1 n=1 Tax=Arabidopsis suecica TaxID=45249 RepID=A0A8T2HBM7_ARASU|nr:Plant self-incompatibility S1 [Arabidopsis suecica]